MRLTFTAGHFILTGSNLKRSSLPKAWSWDSERKVFTTKNIKAAHVYKTHASEIVEKIFKNLMIRPVDPCDVAPLVPANLKLKDFQSQRGVPFLLSRNKAYLAHQPGLGKSGQVVAAINTDPGPALIMPPNFLKINWAREIDKWSYKDFPSISIVRDSSKADSVDWGADYVICPHSMLTKPWVMGSILSRNFKYKVVDEVQEFKTPGSQRAVAIWGGQLKNEDGLKLKSPGLMRDCDHEIYLSGTPLLSKPIDLYPILFGAAPEVVDFMSYQEYGLKYCGAWLDERGVWRFTGSSREEQLHQKLTADFMQIIKKADVLDDLPEKIRSIVVMDRDPRDAEDRKLDYSLLKEFEGGGTRLLNMGQYSQLHHRNGRAKVPWATEFIKYYLDRDEDEKIIVYGYHRDVCEALFKNFKKYNPALVLGGLKDRERMKIVDDFQSGRSRVIVGNKAMYAGLTLTAGTRTVNVEYSTQPEENIQGEDRIHRIGATRDVSYHQYIVLPNSIDETRLKSFHRRKTSIDKIIY